MKRFVKPIISLTIFVLCLLVAELFLSLFAPVPDPYRIYKYGPTNQYVRSDFPVNFHVVTEIDDAIPGLEGRHNFTTNNMGFRGDYLAIPKPANEFRIFMVGGSTTECFYLDDTQAISAVIQNEMQKHANGQTIKVYNAGRSGDASDDHVSLIVHRIVHLQPDMIIVFSGINDLTRSIYNHDYLHYIQEGEKTKHPIWRSLATEFQIPRRIFFLAKRISPTNQDLLQNIPLKYDYRALRELNKSTPISDQRPKTNVTAYANNLETIVGVTRAHNIQLIFMTQQTTWNSLVDPEAKKWHSMLWRNGIRYREDLMDEALESLNDGMRRLADKHSIPLYDLARGMPKSTEYFFDEVHFNVKGAYVAGVELASFILEKAQVQKKEK
jgi:lysophospholipase L1-like esterase